MPVFQRLVDSCRLGVSSVTLKSEVLGIACKGIGFLQREGLSHLRQWPFSLCVGDIKENLGVLRAVADLVALNNVTYKIWLWLHEGLGYNTVQ